MKKLPSYLKPSLKSNDLSNAPEVSDEEAVIYTLLKKRESHPYHTGQAMDIGQVVVWDKKAISTNDKQAIEEMWKDLDKIEPGVNKGVSIRVVSEGKNGPEHITMTQPIYLQDKKSASDYLDGIELDYMEYIGEDPVLSKKVAEGALVEIIPLRAYMLSRYTVEFPKEKQSGLDLGKYISKSVHRVAKMEIGSDDFSEGIISFSGKLDIEQFDPSNPVLPYPKLRHEPEGSIPITPRHKVSFGKLAGNGLAYHVSARVLTSNGQRVKLSDEFSMKNLDTPAQQQEKSNDEANDRPTSRISMEQFAEQIDNIYERLENLERREKFTR